MQFYFSWNHVDTTKRYNLFKTMDLFRGLDLFSVLIIFFHFVFSVFFIADRNPTYLKPEKPSQHEGQGWIKDSPHGLCCLAVPHTGVWLSVASLAT